MWSSDNGAGWAARCRGAKHPDSLTMNKASLSFWMTLGGSICWGICFWWMRRLSIKQNFLLDQLRDQGKRIERLSKVEHDLIKEVHPQVNQIKEGVDEMMAVVKENSTAPAHKKRSAS
jgi:hypothetical protein